MELFPKHQCTQGFGVGGGQGVHAASTSGASLAGLISLMLFRFFLFFKILFVLCYSIFMYTCMTEEGITFQYRWL